MLVLRPNQKNFIKKCTDAILHSSTPCLGIASTGFGKSIAIANICYNISDIKTNAKVLILQPSKEILEQNYAKMKYYGIDSIGIYSASMNSKTIGKYTMATIGSIKNCSELLKGVEYIIIDEVQDVAMSEGGMYIKLFNKLKPKGILGLTATPYKQFNIVKHKRSPNGKKYFETKTEIKVLTNYPLGGKMFWSDFVDNVDMKALQDEGYLTKINYHAELPHSNLRINTIGSNYNQDDVESYGNEVTTRIISGVKYSYNKAKRILVFAPSVKCAKDCAEALQQEGYKADWVSGTMTKKKREDTINLFRDGTLKAIVNCKCLSAGFDVPAIDTIIYALPTLSATTWVQSIGRGVRLDPEKPDKVLTVYDLSGTYYTFGRVENIRIKRCGNGWGLFCDRGRIDNKTLRDITIEVKRRERRSYGQNNQWKSVSLWGTELNKGNTGSTKNSEPASDGIVGDITAKAGVPYHKTHRR